MDKVKAAWAALDARMPRGWWMALLAVLACAFVVLYGQTAWTTPVWLFAKLSLGAVVGYWADRMGFPGARPHELPAGSPEQQSAWRRRSVIIAACAVAAGISA